VIVNDGSTDEVKCKMESISVIKQQNLKFWNTSDF